MASLTGTFDDSPQTSAILYVPAGESFNVALVVTQLGGVIVLEEMLGGDMTSVELKVYDAAADENLVNDYGRDLRLRLRSRNFDEGDEVAYTLADYDAAVNSTVTGTLAVTGAVTLSSTVAVTGAATFSSTVKVTGATASNVTKLILDGSGNAVAARCATANIPTGAGYAKGCILTATDGTDHTNTVFFNIGDATTANFNAATIASD